MDVSDLLFFLDGLLSRKDTDEDARHQHMGMCVRLGIFGLYLVITSGGLLLDSSLRELVNRTLCEGILGIGLLLVIIAIIRWPRKSKPDP